MTTIFSQFNVSTMYTKVKVALLSCLVIIQAHAQEKPIVLEHPDFQAALALLHLTPAAVKPWQEELRKSHELIEAMTRK